RELLVHDHLLELGEPGYSVLFRPGEREVAVLGQRLAPIHKEPFGVFGLERPDSRPLGRELLAEELANLHTKALGLRRVSQLHRRRGDPRAALTVRATGTVRGRRDTPWCRATGSLRQGQTGAPTRPRRGGVG